MASLDKAKCQSIIQSASDFSLEKSTDEIKDFKGNLLPSLKDRNFGISKQF